ncbi:hypothetical protein AVEN_170999-1 [Araneus ventricosus]|uniref:Uncharacterized protein n=1 Tax=Araneus ventricosus TaxID=182803 RepID=A0A4Y2VHY4_ARAVE|nr:hypothetical protein AVEN_170999-1 [Araneus ventricosus]
MTRTTHELTHTLQTSEPHQWEEVWPLCMIERATGPMHSGSSLKSDFKLGTQRPKAQSLPLGHRVRPSVEVTRRIFQYVPRKFEPWSDV